MVSRSFEVPNPVVENSIREEPIYDVPIDHNPVKEYQNVDNGSLLRSEIFFRTTQELDFFVSRI